MSWISFTNANVVANNINTKPFYPNTSPELYTLCILFWCGLIVVTSGYVGVNCLMVWCSQRDGSLLMFNDPNMPLAEVYLPDLNSNFNATDNREPLPTWGYKE